MRDYLLDVVKHTLPLGAFSTLRIEGTDTATEITASEEQKHMVLKAKFNAPCVDLKGVFGIPDLNLLNTIIGIEDYANNATIEVRKRERNGETVPVSIFFSSENGDFENEFRLIGENIINKIEPQITVKTNNWPVEFGPHERSQLRYKRQLSANSDEKTVKFDVRDGVVTVYFGDGSNHHGRFEFATGIDDSVTLNVTVNRQFVAGIFAMTGDKVMSIGPSGVKILVDSGLVTYDYILPNITK